MSVRRKGPRATIVRIVTYLCLVSVAVIVVFPFVVAFATSTKNSQDIFNYPPTLIPKEPQTVDPAEVALSDVDADEPLPLYAFPDSDTRFALVDNDVSVAEFRLLDDVDRIIRLNVTSGEKTGEVVIIDGAEEDIFAIEVDGTTVEAYRSRLTSGGQFVSLDDPTDVRVELVNVVQPLQQFGPRLENFEEVLIEKDFGRSLTNTVLVTIAVVSGQILTSILGGYAFARIKFKGSGPLFLLYLGSVMVPFVVLIIPLFQLMLQVGWLDNLSALIIPFMFSAYGTFLMRQFFISIPIEIEEAALLDNASRWEDPVAHHGAACSPSHCDAGDVRIPLCLELILLAAGHHQFRQSRRPRVVACVVNTWWALKHRSQLGVRRRNGRDGTADPGVPVRSALFRRELRFQRA